MEGRDIYIFVNFVLLGLNVKIIFNVYFIIFIFFRNFLFILKIVLKFDIKFLSMYVICRFMEFLKIFKGVMK